MLDIKYIRDNPDQVREALAKKKFVFDLDKVLELDTLRKKSLGEAETKRAEQRIESDQLNALPKGSAEFLEKVKALKILSEETKKLEKLASEADEAFKNALLSLPNIPHPSVPLGSKETDSPIIATWGDINTVSSFAIPHYDISWFSKSIDFARGVKVTGAGFPFYLGDMARLVRALLHFFLDEAHKAGYIEMIPPILVNEASGIATGQLPDKEGQMYYDSQESAYLIPTAEVPVTNFFRDEIIEENLLPIKRCAYTPCFRREAGSWGKDVRGLNRLHQFDKVEIVQWTHPDKSFEALENIREHAESLLQKLAIPYRVLSICSGDIGFPHSKQYDLEVWAGGQKRWLEVSSCSNFTDFQARRANIRFRPKAGSKPEMVHTLNGSALAIPRVLAAILENNIQEDGSIKIPDVLKPWLGKDSIIF